MSVLSYGEAILLGAVQGLAEFLPISSSGHLALLQHHMNLDASGATMLLFDVLSHVATLLATLIVFFVPLRRFVVRLVAETSPSWTRPRYAWRIALLGAAATVPTGVIGLTLKDRLEAVFGMPRWIGVCLIVTAALLILLAFVPRGRRGWKRFTWWQAVVVGLAQGGAILPGISRSGTTICVASYLGLRRLWAAEFSFLIAAPAILGATLLQARDTFRLPPEQLRSIPWGPVMAGGAVALVVGVVALLLLLGAVRRAKLHYFSIYCFIVGVLAILSVIP